MDLRESACPDMLKNLPSQKSREIIKHLNKSEGKQALAKTETILRHDDRECLVPPVTFDPDVYFTAGFNIA